MSANPSKKEYVYKYRIFNKNHIQALFKNEIWFSVSSEFNDPFDSTDNAVATSTSFGNLKKFIQKHDPETIHKLELVASEINKPPDELLYMSLKIKDIDYSDISEYLMQNLTRSYIFSTSLSPFNKLMWSHYGDYHKGFCVRYDVSKLKLCNIRAADKVNYNKNRVDLFDVVNSDDYFKSVDEAILTKSEEWKYEEEYRFILEQIRKTPEEKGHDFKNKSISISHLESGVDGIYFGLKACKSDKDFLKVLLANRGINFYEILPKDGVTFDLEERLISN